MKKTVLALLLTGLCFGGTTVQAEEEVQQAADQGAASAHAYFGGYYYGGGRVLDYRQVFTWIRKAAEQAVDYAHYSLGVEFTASVGMTQDYKFAATQTQAGQYLEKRQPRE